jgi:hypothetical protein
VTLKIKILLGCAIIAAVFVVGTAVIFNHSDRPNADKNRGATSPLGGLFDRVSSASDLKRRMGELREVYPALASFAQAHEDDLPKSVAELRPYLPGKLSYLDDEHWSLPATGKMGPLVNGKNANQVILLQQKIVFPERPKIIVYGDGHIEYRN